MQFDAPFVEYVIAAYAVALLVLAGLAFRVVRGYKKARDENQNQSKI